MEFDNAFEVPLPPPEAWRLLLDIEQIAPCLPGAKLTEKLDDRAYKGTVAVRLGPVALTFSGTARFEAVDDAGLSARVKAAGTDTKGRGGANAVVGFRLEPAGTGSRVLVHTDLRLSGSVAQYGRGVGMIQDMASQLIGQFAQALKQELAQAEAPPVAAPAPPPAKPIAGFPLVMRALWHAIQRLFSRRSPAS